MRKLIAGPWWRLPAVLVGAGAVLLVIDIVAQLGWLPYIVAGLLITPGLTLMANGGIRSIRQASILVCVVMVISFTWIVHPEGWNQPGWTVASDTVTFLGRGNSVIVVRDGDWYTGRQINNGKPLWHRHYTTPPTVNNNQLIVKAANHPGQYRAFNLSTHKRGKLLSRSDAIEGMFQDKTTKPTPSQVARLPKVHGGDKVLSAVAQANDAAQLISLKDFTGHHYERLDVLTSAGESSYRVKGGTGLTLYNGVLMIRCTSGARFLGISNPQPGTS